MSKRKKSSLHTVKTPQCIFCKNTTSISGNDQIYIYRVKPGGQEIVAEMVFHDKHLCLKPGKKLTLTFFKNRGYRLFLRKKYFDYLCNLISQLETLDSTNDKQITCLSRKIAIKIIELYQARIKREIAKEKKLKLLALEEKLLKAG